MSVPSPEYRFGPFRVVDGGRALLRDGEAVPISPKVLAVLVELLRVPGKVVSKQELLETVWAGSFVEEGNLTQSISVLRKQLAADFPDESPVETLPRVGYRFRIPVETAYPSAAPAPSVVAAPAPPAMAAEDAAESVAAATANPESHASLPTAAAVESAASLPARSPRRGALMLGVAVALCASAALAIGYYQHRRVLARNRYEHRRVAVLDFRDLSQSHETAWLRGALQETIGNDLAANSDLEVVPAADVERAERELGIDDTSSPNAETLRRLATDLDCDDIVAGSYLSSGGSIRLDTHLLAARDGSVLGNNSQTESADHLLTLIADGSQAIRHQFGLPPANSEQLQAATSADPEAFALYAKGLQQLRQYDGPAASRFFEQAIALDPKFPLAHLAYSSALTTLGQEQRAAEQARIAQSLAGNLPHRTQLAIQARVEQTEGHFDQAANTFGALSTIAPEDYEYVWMRASMLDYGGHPAEAAKMLLPLLNTHSPEPNAKSGASPASDPRLYSGLADTYSSLGDWPASLQWAQRGEQEARRRGATVLCERLLTTESQAELYLHKFPEAEAHTQEALQLARQFHDRSGELRALNRLGQIYTAQGRFPDARTMLEQALVMETAGGEIGRQIHTLSALGQNMESSGNHAEAVATFARELKLAQPVGQPDVLLGAQLDVAREQMLTGHAATARPQLEAIAQRAAALGDKEMQAQAESALRAKL